MNKRNFVLKSNKCSVRSGGGCGGPQRAGPLGGEPGPPCLQPPAAPHHGGRWPHAPRGAAEARPPVPGHPRGDRRPGRGRTQPQGTVPGDRDRPGQGSSAGACRSKG